MNNNQLTNSPLPVANSLEELQQALLGFAQAGKTVALVPTMGALHSGHASLIGQGKEVCDEVVVSVFVNPTQFGANEDFDRYPRTLEADIETAKAAGASLIYNPTVEDMYPEGFSTLVSVGEMGKILCGKFRPGHFDGVATVVAKLLMRVMPHVAIFGLKDYQQFCIIQRLVQDLDLPTEIMGAEIVREGDGLALSSRNRYLSADERALAPQLYKVLVQVAEAIEQAGAEAVIKQGISALSAQGFEVDYLEIFEGRLLGAAWLGSTRLIDNIELG